MHAKVDHRESLSNSRNSSSGVNPEHAYAVGNLYLQRAADSRSSGQADQVQFYREQAAGAFAAALKMDKRSLPADSEALARSAVFVAHPKENAESFARIWSELERLDASRRRPWLIWNAALVQIWYGEPAGIVAACDELLTLLEDRPNLEDSTRVALAQAVARACNRAEDVGRAETLAELLNRLSENTELSGVKRFSHLGISATTRVRFAKIGKQQRNQAGQQVARLAKADPGNGSLALLLANINLESGNLREGSDRSARCSTRRQI